MLVPAPPWPATSSAAELPLPPGARVETLPRAPGDKPQETFVAVNPSNPRHLLVSYHRAIDPGSDHHPDVRVNTQVARSVDAGQTWVIAPNTTHERYRRSLDASIAMDRHGHAFLIYLAMDAISMTGRHGQYVRRSMDGGQTFAASPTPIAERPGGQKGVLEHMPHIFADTGATSAHAGNVYYFWDRIHDDPTRKAQFGQSVTTELMVSRSTDDGKTWSSPKAIVSYPNRLTHWTAIGADGTLYTMFALLLEDRLEMSLIVSRDGGQTFDKPRCIGRATSKWPPSDFARAGLYPTIGIDPRRSPGTLCVVWGDYRYGDRDILAMSSTDAGRTWSEPVRVNDDPQANGKDQISETLAVDPSDGSIYVLFHDRRGDPQNRLPTLTLARSTDGGRSFVNYAWTRKPSDPVSASLGDYIGLAAQGGMVYGAWADNVDEPAQSQTGTLGEELDRAFPSAPTAIRVGIADFRGARAR